MKKILTYLLAMFAMTVNVSCNDDEQVADPMPEVQITVKEIGYNHISFTVSADNANKGAYLVLSAEEIVPDASRILSEGTRIDFPMETPITVDELISSSSYKIVVAVTSENGNIGFTTAEVKTNDDPAIVLERATGKHYGNGSNWNMTVRGTVDNIDYEISLDLYDEESISAGYITEGIYMVSSGSDDGSLNSEFSYVQKDNDQYKFVSGTLEVKISGNEYSLRIDAVLNDNSTFIAAYKGVIDNIEIK